MKKGKKEISHFLTYLFAIKAYSRKNTPNRFNGDKRPWEPIRCQKALRTGKLMFICNHICDGRRNDSKNFPLCLSHIFSRILKCFSLWSFLCSRPFTFLPVCVRECIQRLGAFTVSQRHSINIARSVEEDPCFSQSKALSLSGNL